MTTVTIMVSARHSDLIGGAVHASISREALGAETSGSPCAQGCMDLPKLTKAQWWAKCKDLGAMTSGVPGRDRGESKQERGREGEKEREREIRGARGEADRPKMNTRNGKAVMGVGQKH